MLDSLIVPLLVTTDLPPEADLAEFGGLLTGAARTLDREGASYPAFLAGKVFWLDQPGSAESQGDLRFAALLGFLAASGSDHEARTVVADARKAISAAVDARYGDVGAATPAVMAIRATDVRERTPSPALFVETADALPDLVAVTRPYT
ncbi:hypothetical protein ACFXJ8_13690 [Nonomuraea sp. NPDC059194]|uniref:hypothetical protein n=1 Tax=Nonomuraea sp. NPDC059194 TaxID=3346764 RepID=UPI00367C5C07